MAGSGRWQRQAALDAALKFGPQRSSLRESLREARENYGQTVRAGNSTATLTQRAADAARPEIEQAYAASAAPQQAGATLVSKLLAGLPGVADQFKGDQASEAAQTAANLGASKARDLAMLSGQGVAARAGAQFNQQLARSTLTKAVAGLLSKQGSLAGEEGAFASSEADKLAREAESNEQQERASERSAATSRENSKESNKTSRENSKEKGRAAGGGYVDGVKQRTPEKQEAGAKELGEIRGIATAAFREGHNRGQVISILSSAEPSISKNVSERDKNGKPTGVSRSVSVPGRKAYSPSPLMAAALDEAQFGGITPNTVKRLHLAGYSVRQLGVKVLPASQVASRKAGSQLSAAARKALAPLA